MKQERDAWLPAERLKKQVEALERCLKRSEQERGGLVAEVARQKAESQHWEKALDTLQVQSFALNLVLLESSRPRSPDGLCPANAIPRPGEKGSHVRCSSPVCLGEGGMKRRGGGVTPSIWAGAVRHSEGLGHRL